MSNLGYTDPQWTRFFREPGIAIRLTRTCAENLDKYTLERTQVRNLNDVTSATPHFTAVTLSGVNFGTNTAEDGTLYVRIVANGGNWDVNLYTAAGASGLVAAATNVPVSTLGTLVAQNNSGLSGTVTLGATVVAEIDDKHQLRAYIDWKVDAGNVWPSDGTTDEDSFSRAAWDRMMNDLAALERQKIARVRQFISELMVSAPDNASPRGVKFLQRKDTSLISERKRTDPSGAVSFLRSGSFETLRQAMVDEGTGSTQYIIQRVVAGSAGVFDANNDGQGTVASHTPLDQCKIGTWTFECVSGEDNGTGGREQFNYTFQSSIDDENFTGTGLIVGQSFTAISGFGGGSGITLVRTLTKNNDPGDTIFAAASGATVSGESSEFTDGGIFHVSVVSDGAGAFDVKFYRSASKTDQTLVAQATTITGNGTAFTATERNGSGIEINWTTGSAFAASTDEQLDLNFFLSENSTGNPDRFTVTTTLTSEGLGAKHLSEQFNVRLNGIAAGGETIPEGLIATANTFEPFIVQDN